MKNFNEFVNELKMGYVNFSDLHDNWSAEYNLSDELKEIKKDYKKLGKVKLVDKVIKLVKKIDETTYKNVTRDAKKEFNITLPTYKSATNQSYWSKKFTGISRLIITLNAVTSGLKIEKEKIKEEIKNLQDKLNNLEDVD